MVAELQITNLGLSGQAGHILVGTGSLFMGHYVLLAPIEYFKIRAQLLSRGRQEGDMVASLLPDSTQKSLRSAQRPYAGAGYGFFRDTLSFAATVAVTVATQKTPAIKLVLPPVVAAVLSNALANRRVQALLNDGAASGEHGPRHWSANLFTTALAESCVYALAVSVTAHAISDALHESRFIPDASYGSPLCVRSCQAVGLGAALTLFSPLDTFIKVLRCRALPRNGEPEPGELRDAHSQVLPSLFLSLRGYSPFGPLEAAATVLGVHLTHKFLEAALLDKNA